MDFLSAFLTPELIHNGIQLTTPILFGALAAALSSRAGVLNLAIEAKMLVGAFVGLVALDGTKSQLLAIIVAAVAGGITGALMAAAHRVGVDLIVFAIGLNMLLLELSIYLMRQFFGGVGVWTPDVETLPDIPLPFLEDVPVLGPLVSGYNGLVYLAFACAAAFGLLFRYRPGRHLLAVGEAPGAASAAGISVPKVQTLALIGSGALAALGGAFLTVGELGLFARNMTDGAGWIAITAALLAVNRPVFLVPASLLFGFSDAFAIRLQSTTDLPQVLVQLIPMAATLIVLGFVGYRGLRAKETLGLPRRARRQLAAVR
ncbi:ABC transporter permease [Rathayibacter sp. VKM Ac-2759]|uniref:ABC transporter permease n=1 Tax=Rathayibacter sp. VKM Ac-2759 TaxID=2609252 RepID=UPI0013179C87|nr:ABC transporter permease [Rathayibacter sp. VKM Ac-2759]QHC65903.1 ABC transporter permease [Rathayibacter sp. VKM Ac-2759]